MYVAVQILTLIGLSPAVLSSSGECLMVWYHYIHCL